MGFHGDVKTFMRNVDLRLKFYAHENNKPMSTNAVASMISIMLYNRRFFPYYAYNIVAGLDEEGMFTTSEYLSTKTPILH